MIIEVKWPWTFFDTLGSITNKLKSCHKKHLEDWFVLAIDRERGRCLQNDNTEFILQIYYHHRVAKPPYLKERTERLVEITPIGLNQHLKSKQINHKLFIRRRD